MARDPQVRRWAAGAFAKQAADKADKTTADPLGWCAAVDDSTRRQNATQLSATKATLESKAKSLMTTPFQQLGMQIFMVWMMGSSGIFAVLTLGYALSSAYGVMTSVSKVFEPLERAAKGSSSSGGDVLDLSLYKLGYLGAGAVLMLVLLYQGSGLGLIPSNTGDWVSLIPAREVVERLAVSVGR